jgi:hypothetical protein
VLLEIRSRYEESEEVFAHGLLPFAPQLGMLDRWHIRQGLHQGADGEMAWVNLTKIYILCATQCREKRHSYVHALSEDSRNTKNRDHQVLEDYSPARANR